MTSILLNALSLSNTPIIEKEKKQTNKQRGAHIESSSTFSKL